MGILRVLDCRVGEVSCSSVAGCVVSDNIRYLPRVADSRCYFKAAHETKYRVYGKYLPHLWRGIVFCMLRESDGMMPSR